MPAPRRYTPARPPVPTQATAPDADLVLPADERGPVDPPTLILDSAPFFWEKYKAVILGAIALVVVGLVGSAIVGSMNARKLTDASAALGAARTPEEFQKVIDAHGSSLPAADAHLLLARAQREKGDAAGAEKTLRTFLDRFPKHPLAGGASLALAGELQSSGQADAALGLYQQTADRYRNTFSAPLALFAKAELLRTQGKTDDARRAYETLIATYAQSIPGRQAVNALRMLRGPAPAALPVVIPTPAATLPAPTTASAPVPAPTAAAANDPAPTVAPSPEALPVAPAPEATAAPTPQ